MRCFFLCSSGCAGVFSGATAAFFDVAFAGAAFAGVSSVALIRVTFVPLLDAFDVLFCFFCAKVILPILKVCLKADCQDDYSEVAPVRQAVLPCAYGYAPYFFTLDPSYIYSGGVCVATSSCVQTISYSKAV